MREAPDRRTPTVTFLESKFYIASSSTSNQHETCGCPPSWHLKRHGTLSPESCSFSLHQVFPVLSFSLDSRVLQKLILTDLASSLVVLGEGQSPRFFYSTIFGCPALFAHSVFGGNPYAVSLKIPKVEASAVSLQPVVHLDPRKTGPATQNTSKNKCIKEHGVLLSLRIICSALAQHDL